MAEKQRNPKLDIETNVPVILTIGKNFWKGKNDYGPSYGYNVTYDGSEYTFFASEFVHERFQSFGQGTTVKICKRQKAGEKNIQWEIGEISSNGHSPEQGESKPKYEPATFNREGYREQRIQRMCEALEDAQIVRRRILDSELFSDMEIAGEDLRSIAISFVIEENRDHIPLKPVEKPPDANIPAMLEAIKKTLTDYIPGDSEVDKTAKADLLEKGFGVRAWQPVTQMSAEQLSEGHAKLQMAIKDEEEEIPF